MVTTQLHTADELWTLVSQGERFELIEGELFEVSPGRRRHGIVQLRIASRLLQYVEAHNLGIVTTEEGFLLQKNPDTVLGPNVAFTSITSLAAEPELWSDVPPDLVVEVMSPSNNPSDIERKVRVYLDAGVRVVWIANPANKRVVVYEPGKEPVTLANDESLDGGEVLPGFTLSLTSIFNT